MSDLADEKGVATATPDRRAAVAAEIAALSTLDLHELRVRWRKLYRTQAPPHLTRPLLLRILAYKIQAKVLGDLDRDTVRFLERLGRQRIDGEKGSRCVPPVPASRPLKPGTLLVREHDGIVHQVIVLESGSAWNENTYKSLSEIARAITGTNWNGPRFFGLRDKGRTATKAGKQP